MNAFEWAMLLGARKGRTASRIIAAADTPVWLKHRADYVCDGTADDVQIRQACNDINALSNAWTHYGSPTTPVIKGSNFPLVAYDSGTYYAYGGDATYANIVCQTSTDGVTWTNPVAVLAKGALSSIAVSTVWKEGAVWYMLYRASGTKIHLATSSDPLTGWTNYASNPVINDGIACDPAGVMKVGSTYYLYVNTTSGDRELNIYTSTDLHTWVRAIDNPVFTGTRYCSCPFTTGGVYYILVSRNYFTASGLGGCIELWSSSSPLFPEGKRIFLGVVIYNDEVYDGPDTPTIPTTDITRSEFVSPDGKFWCYYARKVPGGTGGVSYPGLLTINDSVSAAIANVVMPKRGHIQLLEGTYYMAGAVVGSGYGCIDLAYGVSMTGNGSTLKLPDGFNLNLKTPGAVMVDYDSILRNVTIDGNGANLGGGTQTYGLVICRGGLAEFTKVKNWPVYGALCRGIFKNGKVLSNLKFGIYAKDGGKIVDSEIAGNNTTSTGSVGGVVLGNNGILINSRVYNNFTVGVIVNNSTGDAGLKPRILGGECFGNGSYGVLTAANTSIAMDNVRLYDNVGYSSYGQLGIQGFAAINNCYLYETVTSHNYQAYLVSGSTGFMNNCYVKGGAAKIQNSGSMTVGTIYDITGY